MVPIIASLGAFSAPAYAAITIGSDENATTIEGWEPDEMVSTDMQFDASVPNEAASKLENAVVRLIKLIMPFLMIACVAIIVGNGIANIFRPKEKRVSMGELLKNMIVQFFYILFAFIIVEAIVFVVTGGQALLFATIL